MSTVVGIGGYATVGKDATAGFLVQDWGFKRYAFADILRDASVVLDPALRVGSTGAPAYVPLSRILQVCGSWDIAKVQVPSVRHWLQILGTEVGRDMLYTNVWVDACFAKIERDEAPYAVLPDVRFPNEVRAVSSRGGITVWVRRPGVGPVNSHVSDNALGPDDFDVVVDNDGDLPALRQKVDDFVTSRLAL